MKQKILMLITAMCMATVALPQKLLKQYDKKVFAFENDNVVLKTMRTSVYSYDRPQIDSGYEPLNEYATLFSILDTIVTEKVEASFPIKNIELVAKYDTSDYRSAFMKPNEIFYSGDADTVKVLKNYLLTKSVIIKKYGISFDGTSFNLSTNDETSDKSILLLTIFIWLLPSIIFIVATRSMISVDKEIFLREFTTPKREDLSGSVIVLIISFAFYLAAGMMYLFLARDGYSVVSSWPIRLALVIFRFVFAYYSVKFVNFLFIKLADHMEAKMDQDESLTV